MTTWTFDVKVGRFNRHTLTVYPIDSGGWNVRCSCCRWVREDEDGEHWCEGEGAWRIWMGFEAEDAGALIGGLVDPEEYCSWPFDFPIGWDPSVHLVGVIDMRPAIRRERDLIRAMDAGS